MRGYRWLTGWYCWLFLFCALPVSAQSCPPTGPLGVCNLEGNYSFTYRYNDNTLSETIDIASISYFVFFPSFPLTIFANVEQTDPPAANATYTLEPENGIGNPLEISLDLFLTNTEKQLAPGVNDDWPGSAQPAPGALTVNIADGQSLSDSRYTGSFRMNLQAFLSGNTSIDFQLNVIVEPSIGISNLPSAMDLTNPNALAGGNFEGTVDFCVGGRGFESYSVELSSEHGGTTDYQLAGLTDTSERLPYSAVFDALPATLQDSFIRQADGSCQANNASITVSVAESDWQQARQSNFADTLTIMVTAD
ncbi:hypothetical protein Mag101_04210 [Microbulbifer agarilyticus]|uniref:Spore coat protein U domain-containing protein n=1 Tax=Microbulbifer agarilyticus TaxID=260552 RepID=A0A1Q2M2R2_9GAMM|nr:hypothetical protein [Microbulbifer agarilyticus]AQQ66929.1 hypothetical protein Mag101_04210 [Microbulbifer agarilyticus]